MPRFRHKLDDGGSVISMLSEAAEGPGAAETLANTGSEEPLGLLEATTGVMTSTP